MTAGNAARTIRASGRLVVNPTNLSAAYPYGGTEVGRTMAVAIQSQGAYYFVQSEGLGRASDALEADIRHTFGCILRGWDDDAVQLLLSDGSAPGSPSGHQVYCVPGLVTPGANALARTVILLYVPDDLVNVPALLIHAGLPGWVTDELIPFQRQEETVIPLSVDCFPNGDGKVLDIGRLVDLAL